MGPVTVHRRDRDPPRLVGSFILQVHKWFFNNNGLMTSESRYLRSLYYVSLILLNLMLSVWFPHKITLCRDPPRLMGSFMLQVNDFLRITD